MEYDCKECVYYDIKIVWCERYGCKMQALNAKTNFSDYIDDIKEQMIDERYHKTRAKSRFIGYVR